jgi:hypothetical protein
MRFQIFIRIKSKTEPLNFCLSKRVTLRELQVAFSTSKTILLETVNLRLKVTLTLEQYLGDNIEGKHRPALFFVQ